MNRSNIKPFFVVALSGMVGAAVCQPAMAATRDQKDGGNDFANIASKMYVGVQLGHGTSGYSHDPGIGDAKITAAKVDQDSGVWGVILGAQWTRYFGTEIEYMRLPNVTFVDVNGTHNHLRFSQHVLDFALKGVLPLSEKGNLFGKIGITRITHTEAKTVDLPVIASQTTTSGMLGIGFSYLITPRFTGDIFASRYFGKFVGLGSDDIKPTDILGVGITYHFG